MNRTNYEIRNDAAEKSSSIKSRGTVSACVECGAAFVYARSVKHSICAKCIAFETSISKADLLMRIRELERLYNSLCDSICEVLESKNDDVNELICK